MFGVLCVLEYQEPQRFGSLDIHAWIPAFAGMTLVARSNCSSQHRNLQGCLCRRWSLRSRPRHPREFCVSAVGPYGPTPEPPPIAAKHQSVRVVATHSVVIPDLVWDPGRTFQEPQRFGSFEIQTWIPAFAGMTAVRKYAHSAFSLPPTWLVRTNWRGCRGRERSDQRRRKKFLTAPHSSMDCAVSRKVKALCHGVRGRG